MYTCMRVGSEGRYEAKYGGGFIYPLETHRLCASGSVYMRVCVCVCVHSNVASIRIIARKKRGGEGGGGGMCSSPHRKRAGRKGWNVCLKNIIRHADHG